MNARKQGRIPVTTMRSAVPVVLAMLALAACDADDPPPPRTMAQDVAMAGVCVNPNSAPPNQRVDDDECGEPDEDGDAASGGFTYIWFSTGSSYAVPARGQTVVVTNGTRNFPKGTVVTRGLPAAGVPKMSDVRRYPPYVPARPNAVPPVPAKPAPVPPAVKPVPAPPAVKPAPAPNIERGGLGSTSGGTKSGTSGGTSSGS